MRKLFRSETYLIEKDERDFYCELRDNGEELETYVFGEGYEKRLFFGLIKYKKKNVSLDLAKYKSLDVVYQEFEDIWANIYLGKEEIIDGVSVVELAMFDYSLFKVSKGNREIVFEVRDDGNFIEAFKDEPDGNQSICYFDDSENADNEAVKQKLIETFIEELNKEQIILS